VGGYKVTFSASVNFTRLPHLSTCWTGLGEWGSGCWRDLLKWPP